MPSFSLYFPITKGRGKEEEEVLAMIGPPEEKQR
jgi:uncharacterized membrane protein